MSQNEMAAAVDVGGDIGANNVSTKVGAEISDEVGADVDGKLGAEVGNDVG